ncbi:MAG: hypothetical protein GY950_13800 [bacterium]|nr:hypothetical protein [bacterium]
MKKIILALALVTTLFTGQVFGIVYANHTCNAYDGCDTGGGERAGSGMAPLIVEGASYFLKSRTHMLMLLNGVELSELNGTDYTQWQAEVNAAAAYMEQAGAVYDTLIAVAGETPYNGAVIDKLKKFPYKKFRDDRGLNPSIFAGIENLLSRGDVTGVYILLKSDMDEILERLYVLKAGIDAGVFPSTAQLWRLNQDYAESLLAGQYAAEVFANL